VRPDARDPERWLVKIENAHAVRSPAKIN
jgi:hypothetical protein